MRRSMTKSLLGLAVLTGGTRAVSQSANMSSGAAEMFTHSMNWLDLYYDPSVGYLHNVASQDALRYETRSSAWYALGLLARNEGDDAAEAEKIIKAIIGGQFKDPSEEWYGDYTKHPFEPYVGSDKYEAKRYSSWDPNWRGFIGTTFVLALEEYSDLINEDIQGLMMESLYNCSVGDSYRFGSLEPGGDNLWPAYSNPAIMRAFVSGWTGRKLEDSNMTKAGEDYAQEILDLFDRFDTLSEFNSGTYTGVSLFGLHLWAKYLPSDSIMTKNGPRMIKETWKIVSRLWHPGFRNMAGPWDRTYGYDMNRYVSLMALWFWPLIGREKTGLHANPQIMSHNGDYAWAPVLAAIVDEHRQYIPEDVLSSLSEFSGPQKVETSAYYPPYDNVPRNFTTWMMEKLTIGAESHDQIGVGGATGSTQFNPAVVQWDTGDEISFISLWPTEKSMRAKVYKDRLELSYPKGNADSVFRFIVGTQKSNTNFKSWEDLKGLKVTVSGNVEENPELTFGGAYGGKDGLINNFENWRFTYKMPSGFSGVPKITLHLEVV